MLEFVHQLIVSLLLVCRRFRRIGQMLWLETCSLCETVVRSMSHRDCLECSQWSCLVQPFDGWPLGGRNQLTAYFSCRRRQLLLQVGNRLAVCVALSQGEFALARARN